MASEGDVLQLIASIRDEMSPTLKKIQDSLVQFDKYASKSHKQGTELAQKHAFAMQDLKKGVGETSKHIKDILTPALAGLGLTAISVGAAVAGLTTSIKSFGELSLHLTRLRTETGMSVTSLVALEQEAERLGSSAEAMDIGLQKFAENLEQWGAGRGAIVEAMRNQRPEIVSFYKSLQGKDTQTAIPMVIAELKELKTVADKKMMLNALGLDPAMALMTKQDLDEITAKIPKLTEAQIQAGKAGAIAWFKMKEAVQNLSIEIGAKLAPAMTAIYDAISDFIEGPAKEWIDWGIDFAKKNPELVTAIGAVGAAFVVAGAGAAVLSFALSPIVVTFSLIAAAIVTAIEAYKHWDEITGKVSGAIREKVLGKQGAAEAVSKEDWIAQQQEKFGQVPRHAAGGIFTRPSVGMIGEAGPEAVIPLGKLDFATETTSKLILFCALRIEEMFKKVTGYGTGGYAGGGGVSGGSGASGTWGGQQGQRKILSGSGGLGRIDNKGVTGNPGAGVDPEIADMIRKSAIAHGIDPNTALQVAANEGAKGYHFGENDAGGDHGKSGGVYQLFMGGGEGNRYQKETGHSPFESSREEVQRQIDYTMKRVKEGGWIPWHGARDHGISQWQGVNGPDSAHYNTPISGASSSGGSTPADAGEHLVGMRDHTTEGKKFINEFLGKGNSGANVGRDWCADFVAASVKAAGQGDGAGAIASAWSTWGQAVDKNNIQKGDVVVNRRGGAPGSRGGHVAIATGPAVNGRIPVIEGDVRDGSGGHMVTHGWESLRDDVRRGSYGHSGVDTSYGPQLPDYQNSHPTPGGPLGRQYAAAANSGGGASSPVAQSAAAMRSSASSLGSMGLLGMLFGTGGLGSILSSLLGGMGGGGGGLLGSLMGRGGGPMGFLGGSMGKMMAGAMTHQIEGNAAVHINFKNLPKNTNTAASVGGVFKDVLINRGQQSPFAQGA
jgi:hypothetical protein